jgi:oxidase EvaA
MPSDATAGRFLRSALTEESPYLNIPAARSWLADRAKATVLNVEPIPFAALAEWAFDDATGDLAHRSGKFFAIRGIRIAHDAAPVPKWEQPIIDQPEIGILGIITREIDGRLYFLMQAKAEPGNILPVQLTTTVQATRSNYTQVHRGIRPKYIEYFLERGKANVLVDQLQFEQGAAFLRKRNRNMVVEVAAELPVEDDHQWFTLGQIKRLLTVPNLVSMDARTVLSCIPLAERGSCAGGPSDLVDGARDERAAIGDFPLAVLDSMIERQRARHSDDAVVGWLSELKSRCQLSIERVGLRELARWRRGESEIAHDGGRYFQVMAVRVEANTREVRRWDQPLVRAVERGLIALIVKRIDGTLHALIQGKVEPGNLDAVLVGPTVQFGLGSERLTDRASWPPFVDVILNAPPRSVRYSAVQSEEGGRFYHMENDYRIVEIESDELDDVPEDYFWITLRQLNDLLRYGFVNVEARSLAACLSLTTSPVARDGVAPCTY